MNKKTSSRFVKITGGMYRGFKIRTPGGATHPMGERERIALFNMIADRVPGACVLDLYAGSGILGLEAMSRGASYVMAIDIRPRAVRTIANNMEDLGLSQFVSRVAQFDAVKLAKGSRDEDEMMGVVTPYNLVFSDPPYDVYDEEMVKDLGNVVTPGGTVVLSHPGPSPEIPGLKLLKTRQYAAAHLSIYEKYLSL